MKGATPRMPHVLIRSTWGTPVICDPKSLCKMHSALQKKFSAAAPESWYLGSRPQERGVTLVDPSNSYGPGTRVSQLQKHLIARSQDSRMYTEPHLGEWCMVNISHFHRRPQTSSAQKEPFRTRTPKITLYPILAFVLHLIAPGTASPQ